MPNTPITKHMGERLVHLMITIALVQIIIIGYVLFSSWQGRSDLVASQRKACDERGRVANQANADFQVAQTTYITKVIFDSPSVKADVRGHAEEAVATFNRTSDILTQLANIDCDKEIPDAEFFPW